MVVAMTVMFSQDAFANVQQTMRDLRKLERQLRGNTITDKQRNELSFLLVMLTNQLAEHQR